MKVKCAWSFTQEIDNCFQEKQHLGIQHRVHIFIEALVFCQYTTPQRTVAQQPRKNMGKFLKCAATRMQLIRPKDQPLVETFYLFLKKCADWHSQSWWLATLGSPPPFRRAGGHGTWQQQIDSVAISTKTIESNINQPQLCSSQKVQWNGPTLLSGSMATQLVTKITQTAFVETHLQLRVELEWKSTHFFQATATLLFWVESYQNTTQNIQECFGGNINIIYGYSVLTLLHVSTRKRKG